MDDRMRKELTGLRADLDVAVVEIQQATLDVERAQRRLKAAEARHRDAIDRFVKAATPSESKADP